MNQRMAKWVFDICRCTRILPKTDIIIRICTSDKLSNTELAKIKAATVAIGIIDGKSLQSDLRPTFIAGSGFLVSPDG